jgi:hypothetical protein
MSKAVFRIVDRVGGIKIGKEGGWTEEKMLKGWKRGGNGRSGTSIL